MSETVRSFVEIIGRTKTGKPSRRTHKHHWAPCDVCGVGMWVATNRLPLKCRMTSGCEGKHRKVED